MSTISAKDKIAEAIYRVAEDLGYMIYEMNIVLRGENSKILVKIDHENGISHRDCEIFSKHLCKSLDEMEFLPNYFLEVSSPGLNRKIRNMQEFIRFIGAPVKLQYSDGKMKRIITGTIESVSDNMIQIHTTNGIVEIDFLQIINATLAY